MGEQAILCQLAFKSPVMAISFCQNNLLAVGCQDGTIAFVVYTGEKLELVQEV